MSNPNTRTKILNRIARVHAVKVEDLNKLSDADILKRYWRHIRTKDLDDLDQNEVDKCPKVFDKMSNRNCFSRPLVLSTKYHYHSL